MTTNTSIEDAEEQIQFETLIQGLMDNQFGSIDNFVPHSTLLGLRNTLVGLSENGKMSKAGLGNKADFTKDERIRGDTIKWLENDSLDEHEQIFQKKIGSFINYLNQTCFTSIQGFNSHYASYAKASFYKRHLDQFKNDKSRKFSMILYLNDDWQPEDGGLLSLYPTEGKSIEISPIGGRMVLFRSDEMEHEVHPSFTKDRNSIAGWLTG